jgi:iron complex transport system substrate-binding protein
VIRFIVACCCLLLVLPAQAAGIRLVDDAGQRLVFERPPQRIVTLSPHLTELLFAVGAGGQVAGADSASDYPEAARSLPRVGDYSRVNFERMLALRPDLVIVWDGGNRAVDIQVLEHMGLRVLHTRASRLDDLARLLRLLGEASGHAEQGEAAARDVTASLAALRQRYARAQAVPVFYQVWDAPLMTVGGVHWISDALVLCGARNIFADLPVASAVVSREAVLQRAPALILSGSDTTGVRRQWQPFSALPAVRRQAFAKVEADRLHRLTPRLVGGVAELCQAVARYAR